MMPCAQWFENSTSRRPRKKLLVRAQKGAGKAGMPSDAILSSNQITQGTAMQLARRQILRGAAYATAATFTTPFAWAQAYPARPVRIIAGFPGGSAADIVARLAGQWFSDRMGQPFIVENRPGASTNLAAEAVVNAAADGHTLLLSTSANAINATLYERVNFNFIRDVAPVASLVRGPLVLVVNSSLPTKTVPEFIAYAKANQGKLNIASSGNGTVAHVAAELFKMSAGLDMTHVPYRGSPPALTDLVGGQVQALFDPILSSIEFIKSGKLRPLAVTTTNRWDGLPQIPALAEFVPNFEASLWLGLGAPKNTPADVVSRLNREANAALADPKMKSRLADLGGVALPLSPTEFGSFISEDTERWAKVVRASGARPD
jgi:tripartite-type tricarboxylate transporter receptor subunit TctC